ncbi:MAG: C25 family cysteine peptidase [Chitinispirillales bacterium]|jgi:hypothetical protein|nr:C25 family cysteine peptidase [Chitinispirillales bacterium]
MLKKLFALIFFAFLTNSFASISIIENTDNKIVLKISFDSIFYDNSRGIISNGSDFPYSIDKEISVPMKFVNFTADKNSKPHVFVSAQNRITKRIPQNFGKYTNSVVLEYFSARNIPVFSAGITPILSINGNEIVYTTSMILTIIYSYGQQQNIIPKSDYYNSISANLLNSDKVKYTIFKDERNLRRSIREFNAISDKALRFSIGDAPTKDDFNECDLSQGVGIYRITPNDLKALGSDLLISSIKVFASNPNVADSVTPSFADLPTGLVDVQLVIRDKNGNKFFDGDDEILFYAEKIHRWVFNETSKKWEFSFNYTDYRRYYWITAENFNINSNIMGKFNEQVSSTAERKSGDVYFHAKRSVSITRARYPTYGHGDKRYIWKNLHGEDPSLSVEFPPSFVNSTSKEQSRVRFFVSGLDSNFLGFNLKIANDIFSNQDTGKWISFQTPNDMSFLFTARFLEKNRNNYVDFESYDLHYKQNLSLQNIRNLQFYSEESNVSSPISYRISDIPNEFHLFVRHNPKTQLTQLIDSSSTGGDLVFYDSTANGYKYHFALSSGFFAMPKTELISLSQANDLLNSSNKSDYLIVAPQIFLQQAAKLAKHKEKIGFTPKVVLLEDIFNIFSGGVFDPTAIRNFMIYARNTWGTSPEYLVLFGSGHYDYKNISSRLQNFVPIYIATARDFHRDLVSYPIEDFFAYITPNDTAGSIRAFPQLIVGRIPAQSVSEAESYVEKVILMETTGTDSIYPFWRNRPLLVADDDIQTSLSCKEDMDHTGQSDSVGKIIDSFDKSSDIRKVTLFEYPFDNQKRKPLAKNAVINEINNGVSVFNYFGHGSYQTLSDQCAFEYTDIPSLNNYGKYFIFGAFSCSVGFFDNPGIDGLSELLVRTKGKGAIAAISSARTAYASENGKLAYKFFSCFYETNNDFSYTVGQAYLDSKMLRATNLLTFSLLGDPSYNPMPDRKKITGEIQILNKNREKIDTLQKMQNVIVKGELPITINDGISRIAEIILQNPENLSPSRKDGLSGETIDCDPRAKGRKLSFDVKYSLPGMVVSRVSAQITGNSFEIPLMIPPTVMDTVLGSRLKIHVWEPNSGKIYYGAISDGLIFKGYDISNIDTSDHAGPTIAVRRLFGDSSGNIIDTIKNKIVGNKITIDGFNKKSGTVNLEILVSDKSGIDIFSSQSPGGGICVSIERVMEKQQYGQENLTLKDDDFRSISFQLPLSKNEFPASGEYEMTISAHDILQNITTQRYILDVKSLKDEQYVIGDLFCYPSPVRMGQTTTFYFNQPVDNVAEISLKIYTLSGKLVRSFSNVNRGIVWNLTDQRGQKLSPNVYLYRLFVKRFTRSDDSSQMSAQKSEIIKSEIKKLVIYPPK